MSIASTGTSRTRAANCSFLAWACGLGPSVLEGGPCCGGDSFNPEEPPPPQYRHTTSILPDQGELRLTHTHSQRETLGYKGHRQGKALHPKSQSSLLGPQ